MHVHVAGVTLQESEVVTRYDTQGYMRVALQCAGTGDNNDA